MSVYVWWWGDPPRRIVSYEHAEGSVDATDDRMGDGETGVGGNTRGTMSLHVEVLLSLCCVVELMSPHTTRLSYDRTSKIEYYSVV